MTLKSLLAAVAILFACGAVLAEPPRANFTKKPVAVKAGDKVRIDFAVDRETDVAVYVEDADGRIVRHLVAGVLGRNPPEPLKANSLVQSIQWDGMDDDAGLAVGGPFKVRVGMGLQAAYAGQPFADPGQAGPNKIENVVGLAAGPDGRVYVIDRCGGWVWSTVKVLVFRRDGAYEKTIKPFPSNLPLDKAKAAGAFTNSFGAFNPLIHNVQGMAFYPASEVAHQPAVTADGQVVLAVNPGTRLAVLDRDGGIPNDAYAGPALGAGLSFAKYPVLVAAADSKTVYLTGLGAGRNRPTHAIYRVKLPDRGPAEAWFGDPTKPGNDNAHLNDARGLAVDGKGHVLVADFGNNRVVVLNEKDKSFAGSFAVQAPNWLGVDPKSGAVYVQSGDAVVKHSGWADGKEQARLELPKLTRKNQSWLLALDCSAGPAGRPQSRRIGIGGPVLWAACGGQLLRSEDRGAAFGDLAPADCFFAQLYWRPAVDPTRQEIAQKITYAQYRNKVIILNEKTGQTRVFDSNRVAGIEGRTHRLGPDGMLYGQDHAFGTGGIIRFDREGKEKPFEATAKDGYLRGRLPVGHTGTTLWERDFSVARNGDIYVRARGPEYHGLMAVHVYDPQGRFKRIALQSVSDGMYGPRLDAQGNLYILECVKPQGQRFPEEFTDKLGGLPNAASGYNWIYGSIIKFSPAGGAVWFSGNQASPLTYEGWGCGKSVSGLRTTGGCLTGTVAKAPAGLSAPCPSLDAATQNKVTVRLKNDSDGTKATLRYHTRDEGYIESCGPGKAKAVDIKPNGDFVEYTFDMSGEKEWKGVIWLITLRPTDASKGSFAIDWVRIGDDKNKLEWNFNAEEGPETLLPATMKKEAVSAFNRKDGAVLQGAMWWKPGFSPVGDLAVAGAGHCHCTGTDFDVDDFGRVFAPDTGRFRVGVLDTNGNEITSFGGYGNQDNCGPDSYVIDPASKVLRPRKADDPKDLVSPFATPEIGLAWIVGLAVSDRYAYVDDVINKRVLRLKLAYSVEESCDIK